MTHVRLLPATVAHLVALQSDLSAFGWLIGSPVPDGWPEFPETIGSTLDRLRDHPDEGEWWMRDELAPAFRGKGLGTASAAALVEKARATGTVTKAIASTLAHDNPSTAVLRRLGFGWSRELVDPEDGQIWRWELALTAY